MDVYISNDDDNKTSNACHPSAKEGRNNSNDKSDASSNEHDRRSGDHSDDFLCTNTSNHMEASSRERG